MQLLSEFWRTTGALAPSLLLGLSIAGLLHVLVKRDRILHHLGRPGLVSSAKAALVGVPLPLCSCGVLPAALSLKREGASKGAVTSFLISTPQTGVDSIAVTWAVLGLPVAAAKVIAAFIAGLIGGVVTDRLEGNEVPASTAAGCAEEEKGSVLIRAWRYSVGTVFRDIYGWLLLGILISALITVLVQPGQLAEYPVLSGPLGLVAALLLGIPLYVCSIASVPIAAGLIYAGFPVGSALVFLMAGPATNAATMGAVRKSLGGRVLLVYLLTVAGVSILVGSLLNSLDLPVATSFGEGHGSGFSHVLAWVSSLVMLALAARFLVSDVGSHLAKLRRKRSEGEIRTIAVKGMSCSMCGEKVKKALEELPFVISADVSPGEGRAEISLREGTEFNAGRVARAIRKTGYHMEGEDDDRDE